MAFSVISYCIVESALKKQNKRFLRSILFHKRLSVISWGKKEEARGREVENGSGGLREQADGWQGVINFSNSLQ